MEKCGPSERDGWQNTFRIEKMEKSPLHINIHHVGGRDGEMGEFPLNAQFLEDVTFHIYDPDESCLPQVETICQSRGLHFKLHPYIVDDREGVAEFKINHCACTSSLLPPARFKDQQYSPLSLLGDYLYKDAFLPVKTIEAPSITLDSIARNEDCPVDVLSIDTQGSELRVLKGAAGQLSEATVAVLSEVELHELYEGQPLFGDIHSEMRERGFNFMRMFTREARVNYFRAGIGFRGDGMLMSADALFLRDPDHVEAEAEFPVQALWKLAFIAMSFGYLEYALDCIQRATSRPESIDLSADGNPQYVSFLAAVWQLYKSSPYIPQPSFVDMFTVEEAWRRFDADNPHAWTTFDRDRVLKSYFAGVNIEEFRRTMPALLAVQDTELEALLRSSDMEGVADTVREKRINHARMTVESLGLVTKVGGSYHLKIDQELERLGLAGAAASPFSAEEIQAESDRLSRLSGWEGGPSEGWQYPFDLGYGIVTRTYTEVQSELHPWRRQVLLDNLDPLFMGRYDQLSVLDLGACEGAMALALWERGVRDITCVEARSSNAEKARFVFKVKNADIHVVEQNVLSFLEQEDRRYDLVLFMGLLYHLLDPFLLVNLAAQRTKEVLAMETVLAKPRDLAFDNVEHYSPSTGGFFIRHDSALSSTAGLSDLELWPNREGLELLLGEAGFNELCEMDYGSDPVSWYETKQRVMMLASRK